MKIKTKVMMTLPAGVECQMSDAFRQRRLALTSETQTKGVFRVDRSFDVKPEQVIELDERWLPFLKKADFEIVVEPPKPDGDEPAKAAKKKAKG